jgi:hypothetical protein
MLGRVISGSGPDSWRAAAAERASVADALAVRLIAVSRGVSIGDGRPGQAPRSRLILDGVGDDLIRLDGVFIGEPDRALDERKNRLVRPGDQRVDSRSGARFVEHSQFVNRLAPLLPSTLRAHPIRAFRVAPRRRSSDAPRHVRYTVAHVGMDPRMPPNSDSVPASVCLGGSSCFGPRWQASRLRGKPLRASLGGLRAVA